MTVQIEATLLEVAVDVMDRAQVSALQRSRRVTQRDARRSAGVVPCNACGRAGDEWGLMPVQPL